MIVRLISINQYVCDTFWERWCKIFLLSNQVCWAGGPDTIIIIIITRNSHETAIPSTLVGKGNYYDYSVGCFPLNSFANSASSFYPLTPLMIIFTPINLFIYYHPGVCSLQITKPDKNKIFALSLIAPTKSLSCI